MNYSLSKQLVDYYVEQIKDGSLNPGDKIESQRKICKKFNLGRGTVREAIQALVIFNIFDSIPGKGVYVAKFSLDHFINPININLSFDKKKIEDFYELRAVLESWAIKEAINNLTDSDILEFEKILKNMEFYISNDLHLYVNEDYKFHNKLFEIANNELILNIWQFIRDQLSKYLELSLLEKNYDLKNHKEIFMNLKLKNTQKAIKLITHHLEMSKKKVIQSL